jgi:UbiD family decarboxylase
MTLLTSTRQFVDLLRREGELLEITEEIDPRLELAEIQRRMVARRGQAVLFKKVRGTAFPVVTNLYGSQKRLDLAVGGRPEQLLKTAVATLETLFPPNFGKLWRARGLAREMLKVGMRKTARPVVLEHEMTGPDLTRLPQLVCWPEDGGAFITLPLVYTEHPITRKGNLGMYRLQMHDKRRCGMHIQIHRGGGFHHHQAEMHGQALPVAIYVGGPPALTIAAVAPLPENVPEILLASLLMGARLRKVVRPRLSPYPLLADADFCIIGNILPHARLPEGPFGDHYGYYSLKHDYPYVDVTHVSHRRDAIYPATVVGRPPQEDHYIACYLQDLLKPLIGLVMPQVKQVWAYEESGVHSLAAASVRDRYPREALTTSLRILGEGQLSLSKVLMVTDQDVDVKDFRRFFSVMLERCDFARDLFILSNISQDTLDYTGPRMNEGSKMILLGLGEARRQNPAAFTGTLRDNRFSDPRVFCPGALAIQGPTYNAANATAVAQALAQEPALTDCPMVFLLDDPAAATRSTEDFVWHVFTRFEPAADVRARAQSIERFHVSLTPPVVIDCRLKPWYPKVLESDPAVVERLAPVLHKYALE